jgi:hypothetical protein
MVPVNLFRRRRLTISARLPEGGRCRAVRTATKSKGLLFLLYCRKLPASLRAGRFRSSGASTTSSASDGTRTGSWRALPRWCRAKARWPAVARSLALEGHVEHGGVKVHH